MKKNVLLTTIRSDNVDYPLQLGLYTIKAYFMKRSACAKSASVAILPFDYGHEVDFIIDEIKKRKPNVVGFSCYVWNILSILKISRIIKHAMPDTKIVFGGPEASPRASQLVKKHAFIDAVVIGEGEKTFTELLEHWLEKKTDMSTIRSIAYRKNGKVVLTPKRQQMADLDEIPSPYLEKTLSDALLKSYCARDSYYGLHLETMRGCSYQCRYCYEPKGFGGVGYYSLERVEKELKYLLGKGPWVIFLLDSTFNWNKERAKKILRIFIKYNKGTHLHVALRAELLDQEMVDLLYEANAFYIEIGVQSTNKKALQLIRRPFDPEKFKEKILMLNKKGLTYEIQLIAGFPGDNYESLKQSIDWLFGLTPYAVVIFRFMVLPGTYLRRHARHFGIEYMRQPPYACLKSDTFSPQDLEKAEQLRMAVNYFWFRGGFFKKSFYALAEKLSLDYSKIFDEWRYWINKVQGPLKGIQQSGQVVKVAVATIDFVEYCARKYNKPALVKHLSGLVRQDREVFFKNLKFGKKKEERLRIDWMIHEVMRASNDKAAPSTDTRGLALRDGVSVSHPHSFS